MKRNLQVLASASAASLLAFSGLAQTSPPPLNRAARATDLIGINVHNQQDQNIGQVEDLVVDVESGRLVQVVLSTGGFFGRTNVLIALPPGALHFDAVDKALQLDASQKKIEAALMFDNSKWDEDAQFNRAAAVDGHYGEQPYYVADNEGYRNPGREGTFTSTLPHHMDGSINADGAHALDRASRLENARHLETTNNWISTLNPDGTWSREYYSHERRANNAWSRLGYVQLMSTLLGVPVKNLQNQDIGRVENFMVDVSAGRIVAVIVSTGGYLDLADELSAVPPTALRFNPRHDVLQLDASRERLAGSPHFKASEWPDLSQPAYAGGIYRAFDVVPWFNPDLTTGAANSRPNVRDLDSSTLTTLDPGNPPTDANIEAQIRREIIADNGMSAAAKNVKITAIDGRVILCGPVDNAGEKRLIGEIADRIAHAGNVDNQLDVMFTVSRIN